MLKHLSVALLVCLAVGGPALGAPQQLRVLVNGKALPADAVRTIDKKIYVAVRAVGDAFGAYVTTNPKLRTVTVTTLLRQVVLHLNDVHASANGQEIVLTAPPKSNAARIMLPLRAVAAVFDVSVVYRAQAHAVIVSGGPQTATTAQSRTPISSTRTLAGTVSAVNALGPSPSIRFTSGQQTYTLSVPKQTRIAFRDVHGATTGEGPLSAVRPGDALVITLGPGGQLISLADIFASINGTIAGVAGQSMVLQSGRVITADSPMLSVSVDGKPALFGSLAVGDKVSVRADPVSGEVHEVVALTPGGYAAQPSPASSTGGESATTTPVAIAGVADNANRALRAGDTLKVAFDGTPGGVAQFDLSDLIANNAMRETRPGHYEGEYVVSIGTNLTDAPVLARLSKNGASAVAKAAAPLTIITTPPRVEQTAPQAGDVINLARPNIVVTFSTVGNTGMDPASLRLAVGGRDVTSQATRTASFISYYPVSNLPFGTVEVDVKGTDIAGNMLAYRWSFSVRP